MVEGSIPAKSINLRPLPEFVDSLAEAFYDAALEGKRVVSIDGGPAVPSVGCAGCGGGAGVSTAGAVGSSGEEVISGVREIHAAALRWTPEERQLHITAREALASSYGTAFLVPRLETQGRKVGSITLHSDSTPTVWAWRNGSSKPTISKAARQATSYLASRGIFYQAKHRA